jgi:hypothetical protein
MFSILSFLFIVSNYIYQTGFLKFYKLGCNFQFQLNSVHDLRKFPILSHSLTELFFHAVQYSIV